MSDNSDLCQNIVSHANVLWNQLANMSGNLNESGQMTNQPTSNTSSGNPFFGLVIILLLIYMALSIVRPRDQPTALKTGQTPHQDSME